MKEFDYNNCKTLEEVAEMAKEEAHFLMELQNKIDALDKKIAALEDERNQLMVDRGSRFASPKWIGAFYKVVGLKEIYTNGMEMENGID